jgi:hypothetical protein
MHILSDVVARWVSRAKSKRSKARRRDTAQYLQDAGYDVVEFMDGTMVISPKNKPATVDWWSPRARSKR